MQSKMFVIKTASPSAETGRSRYFDGRGFSGFIDQAKRYRTRSSAERVSCGHAGSSRGTVIVEVLLDGLNYVEV